jgi:hypothetical protein
MIAAGVYLFRDYESAAAVLGVLKRRCDGS